MLPFIIFLSLCLVLGNAFPQRSKPNFGSNFDFDSYLEHFTEHPLKQTIQDRPIAPPNQDYRYTPLLGEGPDYIPPLLRTHIPKRAVVKQRAWHSSYQDGNFQRPGMGHVPSILPPNHGGNHQRTHFSMSTGNSNFNMHSKIDDFGPHEAPVAVEDDDDFDLPLVEPVDIPLKQKPIFNKHSEDYDSVDYEEPVAIKVEKERPIFHPEEDEYDKPLVDPVVKISGPGIKPQGHSAVAVKSPSKKISVKEYIEQYDLIDDEEHVVEALTKKESAAHKKNSHMKPNFDQKFKRPNVKNHHQKHIVKTTAVPVFSTYPVEYTSVIVKKQTKNGKVHTKDHNRRPIKKTPVHKNDKKKQITTTSQTIVSGYEEDYETPKMVALTNKESVSISEHGPKKSIDIKPVIKHQKNSIKPSKGSVETGYVDDDYDYDLPVVEVLTKDENVKDHKGKPMETKLVVKDHHKNPIAETSEQPLVPSYTEDYDDYDLPVVELLTKEDHIKIKDHGKKKQTKEKPVVNNHKIPAMKPVTVSSYTKDTEVPEVPGKSKHSHTKLKPKEKDFAEEYELISEEIPFGKEKYDIPDISQLNHKTNDYEYEDYDIADHTSEVSKEHGHKSTTRSPTKTSPTTNSNGYEHPSEPIYQENVKDLKFPKEEKKWPASKGSEIKRIVKREVGLDYEDYDYDLPVVEVISKKETLLPKEHEIPPAEKLGSMGHEFPSVVEDISKKEKPVIRPEGTMMVNKPAKESPTEDYDEYDLPVVEVVQNPVVISPDHLKTDVSEYTDHDDYDLPVVEVIHTKNFIPTIPEKTTKMPSEPEYQEYEHDLPVESIHTKKSTDTIAEKTVHSEPAYQYDSLVVVETHTKKPVATKEHSITIVDKPSKINPFDHDEHENPNVEELTKEKHKGKGHDRKPVKKPVVKGKPKVAKKPDKKPTAITQTEKSTDSYGRYKRERENYGIELPAITYPRVPEDLYERPIDKYADVNEQGYVIDVPKEHKDYFDEISSIPKGNPIHGNFEQLGISDTQVVLDSISINRESPEGREIPVLEVLAVEDRENDPDSGVKVVAINKENGNVDVINIGHENSNHPIEDFADSGSGDVLDERSIPRNLLPMNSNSWSFMTHVRAQERRKFKRCFTPKNETGNCMPIQMCPVPNMGVGGNIDELLRNICIIDEVFIGICCPEFPVESVRVDWGNPNLEPLVDNGQSSPETKRCGKLPSTFRDQDPWPWMAPLISTTSDRVFCGGVLISDNYVLTAAHCTSRIPRNRILVRLGSLDSQTGSGDFAVVEIKRHAQYNPRTMQNDIALLKLSRRVPLGDLRRLVCLPDGDLEDHVGEPAVLLRWQGTSKNGAETLPVISNQDCQNRLGTLIGDSVLCTEPRNEETACNADSGAPLVIDTDGKFTITGVLTWNRNDCDGRLPSIFTRISSYRRWIQNHAN